MVKIITISNGKILLENGYIPGSHRFIIGGKFEKKNIKLKIF